MPLFWADRPPWVSGELIADAIVGHGDRKKTVQSLNLSISDADLLSAIDRMTFDKGQTKNSVNISDSNQKEGFE